MLPTCLLLPGLLVLAAPASAPPRQGTTTVVLVRHAEKADDSGDAALAPAGKIRAVALARAVADLRLDAVVVSDTKRARETAAPAAAARGVTPVVVPVGGDAAAHVKAVVEAVRAAPPGSAVLVVGHSNTLGPIAVALGGPKIEAPCEKEYAPLFVLEIPAEGPTRLLRGSYGAPDPPDATACHTGR